jgi:TonB-linked SusC/RagA family outer membrane protein
MKRILLTVVVLAFFSPGTYAQETTFTGSVHSPQGDAMPGVNITVKGTQSGTITDTEGRFSLSAPASSTLIFSFIGYKSQEVVPGSATTLTITLEDDLTALNEVVVTALGITQEKRALGYATQGIKGSELTDTHQPNLVNAMQGKIAGVRIQNSGGAPGSGASILIRGVTSISPNRSSEPLFVIDGMPISNETITGNLLASGGTAATGTNEQYAFSNRAIDINPDDIETLNVLKGPAATALYGLRGANGVVIITTKKGKGGKPQINYNGSMGWDNVNMTPEIQTQYREGATGVRRMGVPGAGTPFQTYGPRVTENDPVYDNLKGFFGTGVRISNGVNVSGGDEKSNYYASVSNLHQKGIVPNSKFDRTTVKFSGTSAVSNRLSLRGSATYVNSGGTRAQGGDKSIMSALTYHTTSADVNDYLNPDGSMKSYAGTTIDNPRYAAEYSTLKDKVDRMIGYTGANLKVTNWLTADYQVGVDFYGDSRTRIAPPSMDIGNISPTVKGYIVEEKNTYREINSNFLLTATHSFSPDLRGTFMVGSSLLDVDYKVVNTRGEGFGLKNFYDISNTTNKYATKDGYVRRIVGVFGDFKIDYKNMLYVSITGRNDYASTLPAGRRSFFYPSISAGYVFTEGLDLGALSYGKLRASWAQVGKDAQTYAYGQYYESATGFPFNGIVGFRKSTTLGSESLTSEKTSTLELGTELKFFTGRLSLDATYYRGLSNNQIVEVPTANSSGLSRYVTNAGEIRNQGVEVLLSGTPLRAGALKWDVAINWSMNRSKVLSMPAGVNEIIFQDDRIANKLVVGGSIGDLYGRPYKRDDAGRLIIDANGFPTWTDTYVKVGNAMPDWMGGVTNTLTWKHVTFSFLIEVRQGGDAYDTSLRNRVRNGIDIRTALRNVDVVFNGVTEAGEQNTKAVRLDGDTYYRNEARYNGVADILLQDATWVRLRTASLGYSFPRAVIGKALSALSLSVSGNNLWLSTPFKGFDPEGNAYGSGNNQFGYTGMNIPPTRSFNVSINATF